MAFSRARAQSAEADGARARNRTGFFEHDYEQEHEHVKSRENMDWVSKRFEKRLLDCGCRFYFTTETSTTISRKNATRFGVIGSPLPEPSIAPKTICSVVRFLKPRYFGFYRTRTP